MRNISKTNGGLTARDLKVYGGGKRFHNSKSFTTRPISTVGKELLQRLDSKDQPISIKTELPRLTRPGSDAAKKIELMKHRLGVA